MKMIERHGTLNCWYEWETNEKLDDDDTLYSQNKPIAVYVWYENKIKVFDTAGSHTKKYVDWFAAEMQLRHGKKPIVKTYDIKRRDRVFRIKDKNRYTDISYFKINLPTFIRAMKMGYIDKDDNQNNSPTAERLLKFALNNQELGNFTFSGYLIYPPRRDFRATVDCIEAHASHPDIKDKFMNIRKNADDFQISDVYCWAWWD